MNKEAQMDVRSGCMESIIAFVALIITAIVISFVTSCSHVKYVDVNHFVHDTINHTVMRIDSVYDRDSVYVEVAQRGDTIFNTKFVEKWRTRNVQVHDTLYINRTDTTTVVKPVERKLTKWESFSMKIGHTAIVIVLLALLVFIFRTIYKLRARVIKL